MTLVLVSGLLFFDPAAKKADKPSFRQQARVQPNKERRLFCSACRHPITHQDERILVQGGHEHTFTNPHGVTYHIGCFREAAGCHATGGATAAYTWFSGYAWQIVLCANCHSHLGWRFQSGENHFHGLIIDRLTTAGPA